LPELSVAASQAIEIVVVVFAVSRRFVGLLGALRSTRADAGAADMVNAAMAATAATRRDELT
jgi:hypothetical protein